MRKNGGSHSSHKKQPIPLGSIVPYSGRSAPRERCRFSSAISSLGGGVGGDENRGVEAAFDKGETEPQQPCSRGPHRRPVGRHRRKRTAMRSRKRQRCYQQKCRRGSLFQDHAREVERDDPVRHVHDELIRRSAQTLHSMYASRANSRNVGSTALSDTAMRAPP